MTRRRDVQVVLSEQAERALADHGEQYRADLGDETRRVANRHLATVASDRHVETAAQNLRTSCPSMHDTVIQTSAGAAASAAISSWLAMALTGSYPWLAVASTAALGLGGLVVLAFYLGRGGR
jgi:predicted phage tail protein